jgi:dTDP-glucose pyrophosphorylase
MNIVIPMAGRGQRFAEAGFSVPKPLIPVHGRPMYAWAVESLPLDLARRLIFICLQEHIEMAGLGADIRARFAMRAPVILTLDDVTEGQACTVLAAAELVDSDDPLIIYNADTWCRSRIDERLRSLSEAVDGVVGVFRAPGGHWSFAKVDPSGRVREMAEKRRISDWAATGLYHFARGHDFIDHAEAMINADDRINGEFYVAPVYNRMIANGANVIVDEALDVVVFGTPEELLRASTSVLHSRD